MSEVPGEERVVAGRYRLLAPLGQGGMGVVWRARDEVLGREVAVKEVRAPAGLGGTDQQRLYARLEREAWAAARVSHRNVVTVYDVATQDGRPWIVMELVRGLSLSDVLDAEGALTPQRAAQIGAEVLAALRAAHEAGVLHRDVKPGNVLLGNDGRVVLTDFGIATVEGTSALTMTGELIGSPEFLAPERALGRTPGPESDLWSLGVLLYAAVEGNSPFRLDTPLSTLRAVVDEELPPPSRAGALRPVIEGLLRKDPSDRMPAADAERWLRTVAAGGRAPGAADTGPHGSPTVTASTPYPTPARPVPVPLPVGGTGSGSFGPAGGRTGVTSTVAGRPRRAVALLAAGVAVLLLGVAALVHALTRDTGRDREAGGGSSGGSSNSAGAGGSSGAADGAGATPAPSDTEDSTPSGNDATGGSTGGSGATGNGAGGTTTAPPKQGVRVSVHAERDSYTGRCPAPEDEAPAFHATITIDRSPEKVEYQWTTRSGETSDGEWRTLDFPAGTTNQEVRHTESAHRAGETWQEFVLLRIRSPRTVTSTPVAFSVTCDGAEPPPTTGEGSAPPATPY
ncbi:serine/threonine-protein kinase [Streptomyces sp. CA-294286]|uniref:serine/threonine-protein kinase n=1 Tax=Streptomyces sp. CA-294286 TaxID=3240070 RepID=UPI003D8FA0BF